MSVGRIRPSTINGVSAGTRWRIVSPGAITPPTVCAVNPNVFYCHEAFADSVPFLFRCPQPVRHVRVPRVLHLQHLVPHLPDGDPRRGDLGGQAPDPPRGLFGFPLPDYQRPLVRQLPCVQSPQGVDIPLDEDLFALMCCPAGGQPPDAFLVLLDSVPQQVELRP